MDREAESIIEQMEGTRESLAKKLETLEQQVVGTVEAVSSTVEQVKDAVTGTVETVKESVEDTVETVKEAFDLQAHVRRHPWLGLGGSFALGCLAGYLTNRLFRRPGHRRPAHFAGASPYFPPGAGGIPTMSAMTQPYGPAVPGYNGGVREQPRPAEPPPRREEPAAARAEEKKEEKPGWLDSLRGMFGNEIDRLKGLAVGTALGVVRDMLTQTAPREMAPQLADIVNGITGKLGGEVIRGPIIEQSHDQGQASDIGRTPGRPAETAGTTPAATGTGRGRR